MKHQLTKQESFFVAGIAVRTNNQHGKAMHDIGRLWTRFFAENIRNQISNRYAEDIYCVYTDYETDHTGWFTTILGCRVHEIVNDGFFVALIPSGNYRIYKPQEKEPDAVGKTWAEIWDDSASRNYIADYDLYKAGASELEETGVEIYVGQG
jgi:predicted transcriptional regulator YdeE